jgi:tRNA(Ile)-lysidine synthase
LKTLVATVRRQKLFEQGETVLVAVSGGADSVALLDILTHLEAERLHLVVVHLNHGLRGAAADGDEEFVRSLAAQYRLPFAVRRLDVQAYAESGKLSLEEAGRRARYDFFDEMAQLHGATSIALAHHLDDQAETVLIRLLRGAGGGGLSAMGSCARGVLKRPLLQISRAQIENYLQSQGVTYREDATNADTAILRNSVRHELIPFLRKYNPKVSQRLAATAEILAGDEQLLEQLTDDAYRRTARGQLSAITLDVEALLQEPRGLRLRLYRRALLLSRGDLKHIALAHLEAVDRLIASSRPSGRLKLPGDCSVERSYGDLCFRQVELPAAAGWQLTITGEGSYPLPAGGRLLVERVARPVELDPGSPRVAYLSPQQVPFPWVLRNFLPGDRLIPLGMKGEQKVKDLFINRKIPLHERRSLPLLLSAGRIVWVVGVRMAEGARVIDPSGPVFRVEILDITP